MKTIGLIGGMSWESSAEYYRRINQLVRNQLGGNASAKSVMVSVDFVGIEALQHQGDWTGLAEQMVKAASQLQNAGADCIVLCTNTMHKLATAIEAAVPLPFIHIVDATAEVLKREGVRRVGLLGTSFTMEDGFYQERMGKHGIDAVTPGAEDRLVVHRAIYQELCRGVFEASTRRTLMSIMNRLVMQKVEGIVLGCTELGLTLRPADATVPMYDSTHIHAAAAVEFAMS
jgi:aspartate racemase